MYEGPLCVHEVELVVEPGPGVLDGRGVGEAADGAVHLGQVPARHHRRRLVVDAHLRESGSVSVAAGDGLRGESIEVLTVR